MTWHLIEPKMNILNHCNCKFLYLWEVMFHRQESFACNIRREEMLMLSLILFSLSISRHVRCGLAPVPAQMQNRRHQVFTLWVVIIAANFGFVALQFWVGDNDMQWRRNLESSANNSRSLQDSKRHSSAGRNDLCAARMVLPSKSQEGGRKDYNHWRGQTTSSSHWRGCSLDGGTRNSCPQEGFIRSFLAFMAKIHRNSATT